MNRPRIQKSLHRSAEVIKAHPVAGLTGISLALGACLIAASQREDQPRVIFKESGPAEFKGASILGNPSAAILRGQENQFSKQAKSVLDRENLLLSQIEHIQAEIAAMKESNSAPREIMGPSPAPSPIPGVPTAENSTSPYLSPSPIEASHTGVQEDSLNTAQSAPQTSSLGLGLPRRHSRSGPNMVSFPVKTTGNIAFKRPSVVLPSGSYVKASLLTGVEAPEGKTYPVLLQLDYAYVIPNDRRLDLSGCFMIAKAQGDLSTERVQMQATKLSCVSKRAGMFEREVNGFVADDADNSFAVMGSVNSKQDRVAATAFLSGVVSGIGKAIQQAQTTAQTTPLGGSQSVVTGDQMKYIGAGGASEAASMVTQWYLKQAQNLLPTINVGSGQLVWVVMQDQVDLPKDYFTQNSTAGGDSHVSIYSYFTRIVD